MEKWLKRIVYASLALVLLGASLYALYSWQEKRKLTSVVLRYNQLLEEAQFRAEPNLIAPLVSQKQLGKEVRYIALFGLRNSILESKLVDIKFTSVSIKGETASVVTVEKWKYRELDAKTKRPKETWGEATYTMNYSLYQNSGRWLIGDTDLVKEKIKGKSTQ